MPINRRLLRLSATGRSRHLNSQVRQSNSRSRSALAGPAVTPIAVLSRVRLFLRLTGRSLHTWHSLVLLTAGREPLSAGGVGRPLHSTSRARARGVADFGSPPSSGSAPIRPWSRHPYRSPRFVEGRCVARSCCRLRARARGRGTLAPGKGRGQNECPVVLRKRSTKWLKAGNFKTRGSRTTAENPHELSKFPPGSADFCWRTGCTSRGV